MTIKMPAGTYYIGDLCYVMGDKWESFMDNIDYDGYADSFGIKSIGKIKYCWFGTQYGDGRYEDNFGNLYPVDAGLIGCILVSDIVKSKENNTNLGNIYHFNEEFECSRTEEGTLQFGRVIIETGYDEEMEDSDIEDENE